MTYSDSVFFRRVHPIFLLSLVSLMAGTPILSVGVTRLQSGADHTEAIVLISLGSALLAFCVTFTIYMCSVNKRYVEKRQAAYMARVAVTHVLREEQRAACRQGVELRDVSRRLYRHLLLVAMRAGEDRSARTAVRLELTRLNLRYTAPHSNETLPEPEVVDDDSGAYPDQPPPYSPAESDTILTPDISLCSDHNAGIVSASSSSYQPADALGPPPSYDDAPPPPPPPYQSTLPEESPTSAVNVVTNVTTETLCYNTAFGTGDSGHTSHHGHTDKL